MKQILCLLILICAFEKTASAEEFEFPPRPKDKDFIFSNTDEKNRYEMYCELFMEGGKACDALLRTLCARIGNDRADCSRLLATDCQKRNTENSTEEGICENGPHIEHCYGASSACGAEQQDACLRNNYDLRYCKRYRWIGCEAIGRDSNNEFKNKSCRVFHNEVMIEFWEKKIKKGLKWSAYGERNVESTLKSLDSTHKELRKAIDSINDRLDSIEAQLMGAFESFFPSLEKEREKLEEQRDELNRQLSLVVEQELDFNAMSGICKATKSNLGQ